MNKKLNWFWDSGSQYTSEYQAVLDRATALGYTHPSSAQKVKQNALVVALKAAGIWSQLDLFYVFATDGDRNFAAINWVTPASYKIAEIGSPTFGSNAGFTGDGAAAKLNTQWSMSTNSVKYLQDNASMFGYFSGSFSATAWAGNFVTNYLTFRSDTNRYYINSTSPVNATAAFFSGNSLRHIQRTSSVNTAAYEDGALNTSNSATTSAALPNQVVHILGANGLGFNTCTCGMFGVGASLSGLEASLYSAWNTYLTSL